MILGFKRKPASVVLALALDGNRLEGAVVRRSNGSLQIQQSFSAPLALPPLSSDPELVGREIRNHLDQAGIRERRCTVCLPLSSALMLLVEIPDLPEEDVASFLQMEAERGFPYGQESLFTSTFRFRLESGKQFATIVAVSRNDVVRLEQALKAAQLKPLNFSLGISALQNPQNDKSDCASLAIGQNTVDLQVSASGGIVSLRALNEAFEAEGVQKELSAEFLARELKITIGQLSADFRDRIKTVRILGRGDTVRRCSESLESKVRSMGLASEWMQYYPPEAFPKRMPAQTEVSPALSLAATYLSSLRPCFEFLPPKVKPWQSLTAKVSSKKLLYAGAAAAAILLLTGGAFGVQQWQLSRLQSQWAGMEPQVKDLDNLQQQIKRFRGWFDGSFQTLRILRKVTEAFPDLSSVTCSGVARDNQAFLSMLDKLRAAKEVSNLKVDQVRGKAPLQFTFNFQWVEGGGSDK